MTTVATALNQDQATKPNALLASYQRKLATFKIFKRNDDGTFAVEFAFVAFPFLVLVFGLIAIAFYFFMMTSVEKGMDQMSRQIRTGQAAETEMTVQQFRDGICAKAGYWIDCNKLEVFVKTYPDWAAVKPNPCVDASGVVANNSPANAKIAEYAGGADDIVIVTACYEWEFTQSLPFQDVKMPDGTTLPFLKFGNMENHSHMMQATTAFRSEPFEKN